MPFIESLVQIGVHNGYRFIGEVSWLESRSEEGLTAIHRQLSRCYGPQTLVQQGLK